MVRRAQNMVSVSECMPTRSSINKHYVSCDKSGCSPNKHILFIIANIACTYVRLLCAKRQGFYHNPLAVKITRHAVQGIRDNVCVPIKGKLRALSRLRLLFRSVWEVVGWNLRSVKSVGTLSADLGNITFSPQITYTGSKSRLGSEP